MRQKSDNRGTHLTTAVANNLKMPLLQKIKKSHADHIGGDYSPLFYWWWSGGYEIVVVIIRCLGGVCVAQFFSQRLPNCAKKVILLRHT